MNGNLLWVDDEIDLLRPHIIFLQKRDYEIDTATNGPDAVDMCSRRTYDLVLLDENMPGMTGLEVLRHIKEVQPATPVVMVTKSEEENIMDQAIGSKIADYLIKPVNPNQVLLSLKKNIHRREIISETTQDSYRRSFSDISEQISRCRTMDDWMDAYRRIVYWEIELSGPDTQMADILLTQKEEANAAFAKFVKDNYLGWIASMDGKDAPAAGKTDSRLAALRAAVVSKNRGKGANIAEQAGERPLMSPDIMAKKVFPLVDSGQKVFLVVIDNFRFDQWRTLAGEIGGAFDIEEQMCLSILPTATQYARNAIFSGLMPSEIQRMYPGMWVSEDEDEGKNQYEKQLLKAQMDRLGKRYKFSYHKVNDAADAEKLERQLPQMEGNDLNVAVFNFIDQLSHTRTESKMFYELARDESAYRSITLSWLRHSMLAGLLRQLAKAGHTVVVATDHGSIRVSRPVKIVGERNTNTNLRYKTGRNLSYDAKEVFAVKQPGAAMLPSPNISTSYVFATGASFFAYPNNYNHYVSYYKDTFQHGGVSMEEMLTPLAIMKPKKR